MSAMRPESQPTAAVAEARAAMINWQRAQPDNYYQCDRNLQSLLEFYWGAEKLGRHTAQLAKFGQEAATIVDAAVQRANRDDNLPRLERYSAFGERIEEVIHAPEHDVAGEYIYGSGAIACYAQAGSNLLALALFYLSSLNGEAGHNCPLACTAGIVKTLQQIGSEALKAKYLPRLLDSNYRTRFHGAQFLTEVQGGSDVGANACVATPIDRDQGTWRIHGEKWFCSNVSADLALITARPAGAPAGTKGLGLFLLPRHLDDGSVNGIHIRRLKDKLGTRSLATAEVDFRDAFAYQVGPIERGFNHLMEYVINTSRLYNAVASSGVARRAYLVAQSYARHRRAFGEGIARLPLVQEALAEMRADATAILSGSLYLAQLRDRIESGEGDAPEAEFFRLAVNLNKYRSSITATDVVRRGTEVLGGNGAIETFSVLPRLLRDSFVYEAWEGAHNTLLAQALRDVQKLAAHQVFCARLAHVFASLRGASLAHIRDQGQRRVEALLADVEALANAANEGASICFRPLASHMMHLYYAACLAREAEWEESEKHAPGKRELLEFYWQRRVEGASTHTVPDYLQRVASLSAMI